MEHWEKTAFNIQAFTTTIAEIRSYLLTPAIKQLNKMCFITLAKCRKLKYNQITFEKIQLITSWITSQNSWTKLFCLDSTIWISNWRKNKGKFSIPQFPRFEEISLQVWLWISLGLISAICFKLGKLELLASAFQMPQYLYFSRSVKKRNKY